MFIYNKTNQLLTIDSVDIHSHTGEFFNSIVDKTKLEYLITIGAVFTTNEKEPKNDKKVDCETKNNTINNIDDNEVNTLLKSKKTTKKSTTKNNLGDEDINA